MKQARELIRQQQVNRIEEKLKAEKESE